MGLAADFSSLKNGKQMPSFHISEKERCFCLDSFIFSSIFINYLTTIMREYLGKSEAYHQYADQKHASLLTHGNMYSALQITPLKLSKHDTSE